MRGGARPAGLNRSVVQRVDWVMTLARALVLAAALSIVPLHADADPGKAWAAAKVNLPPETRTVVALDVTKLTSSALFKMAFPVLLAQKPEIKDGLELVKSTCKLDPLTAIEGVVVGVAKDDNVGAVYLALRGVDETTLVACLEAIAKSKNQKDTKVTVTRDGAISELAMGDDKLYAKWIGKDVLVLPIDIDNKAQLLTWAGTKNGLAKAPVGKGVRKVATASALWVVSAAETDLDGVKMKLGYGSLDTAAGALTADLHVVTTSAADAKRVADRTQQDLAAVASGQAASGLAAVLKGITVSSVKDEIVIKASVLEKDLLALAGALLRP